MHEAAHTRGACSFPRLSRVRRMVLGSCRGPLPIKYACEACLVQSKFRLWLAMLLSSALGTEERKVIYNKDLKFQSRVHVKPRNSSRVLWGPALEIPTDLCRGRVILSIHLKYLAFLGFGVRACLITPLTSPSSQICYSQGSSLPPEVVRMIVSWLSRRDLFSVRYLNKTFAAISAVS